MPTASRRHVTVCATPGCPSLATTGPYCDTHTRQHDKARGTTTQRGYGTPHQHHRASVKALVATGTCICPRCHQPIRPDEPWDLDHTDDRHGYQGPAHQRCNRAHLRLSPEGGT